MAEMDSKPPQPTLTRTPSGRGWRVPLVVIVVAVVALVGLTRALAVEVEKHRVLVNAVCPGYTDTDLVRESMTRIAKKTGKSEADALRTILDRAGQSRLVTVEEVAGAVVRLCIEPDGTRGGQTILVDGSTT